MVLALDGADKHLLQRWALRGELPALRSLMDTGTWCTVENPPGLFAGSVWPSFYTGVSPGRHGKYCSYQLESGTYETRRVHGFDSRYRTIWDALSQEGIRSVIIDAPKSDVSKDFNGIQIVDWATEDFEIESRSWPPGLATKIREAYGGNPVIETDVDIASATSLGRLRNDLMARLRSKERLCAELFAGHDWDFAFALFTEVHTAGHLCWHLHDARHPQYRTELAETVGDIVRDVYAATDAVLSRFIENADPDTHIMVYSVNGMGAGNTGTHLLDDALFAHERGQYSGMRYALAETMDWVDSRIPGRIYDSVYPLQRGIRRSLSLPIRDLPYRMSFRVPTNAVVGGVRVNLQGREPNGTVKEKDYDAQCDRLHEFLANLMNVDTGQPVARRIIRADRVFAGEHAHELPDLIVEWNQDAPIQRVFSPESGMIRKTNGGHRTGDHRPDGILFIAGPGEKRGRLEQAVSIYDLAPTLAAVMGSRFECADGKDVSHRLGIGSAI